MKLDIEGSEAAALAGIEELFDRNQDVRLIMEYYIANLERCGSGRNELREAFIHLGFRKGYIIERGHLLFDVASELPKTRATYDLLLTRE